MQSFYYTFLLTHSSLVVCHKAANKQLTKKNNSQICKFSIATTDLSNGYVSTTLDVDFKITM